ncbi:GNAT family N-acetyltransferase [Rhizobium sp. TRM95111]|uniref:GNAT family N-acetyltransferase n=1 Tax=Rhizobium alarense TaxID=2846851 RepID=UPI001F2FC82D|nr:GNAT family N-acetyltransferase [Rhizobium alarense]MCF3641360.1 GNAT family N-acetyltransferase [Rhizobium alarense]
MNAMRPDSSVAPAIDPGPCPTLTTARLVLRPHRASDAEAIAQSLGDYQVARMLARVPVPYDRQDAAEWLNLVTTGFIPGWAFAVTTGDDVHVGCVSIEMRGDAWHLGYWLNRFYWRRGYMSEAVRAVSGRFLMRVPGTDIHSGVFADNLASLKVQQACGFRVAGCGEIFSVARNALVPHIETRLSPGDFRPAAPRR